MTTKTTNEKIAIALDSNGIIHKCLAIHLYGSYNSSNQTKIYARLRKGMPLKENEYEYIKSFLTILSIELKVISIKLHKHSGDADVISVLIKEIKSRIKATHIAQKSDMTLSLVQKYFAAESMPPKIAKKISETIAEIALDIEKSNNQL